MEDLIVNIDVDSETKEGLIQCNQFKELREHFSVVNEKRRHIPKHKRMYIPKRNYLIDNEGRFPLGILNEIYSYVKEIDPNISDKKNFNVTSKALYAYEPSFLIPKNYELAEFKGFEYRDIQEKAIKRIFKRGRGIIQVGTAGGKGLIMASIIKTLLNYNSGQTIGVIVPTHLVTKTLKEFIDEFGFTKGKDVSAWSGKIKPNFKSQIVIVGAHIACSRKEEFEENISNRNIILIDESHIIKKGSVITDRLKSVKTNNIVGVTGTVSKDTEDRWCMLGSIGKVVCKVESKELRDKGYKQKSKVYSMCFTGSSYVNKNDDPMKAFIDEKEYLLSSEARTKFIKNWVLKVCKGNTLIPIDLDYHEEILKESFKDCGRKVYIINGETPEDERERIYNQLEFENDSILIVKVGVMREGISINNLSFMVGYFMQKSYIRIIQLLGRIERLGGNKVPVLFDFWDTTIFSKNHYEKRNKYYLEDGLTVVEKTIKLEY